MSRIAELERQLVEYRTKHEVACSTLDIVKEQRTAAQNALSEQCKETKRLERQNEVLREALQEVKEWDINGWTERGFALPTELRAKIHALLGDTPAAADAGGQADPIVKFTLCLYGFLQSTGPEGYADEAFRVAPEAVRAALDSIADVQSNYTGINEPSTPETGSIGRKDVVRPAANSEAPQEGGAA